ncbi:hypothetical protein [Enterobacter mori]|uniref:hypothetical protein n=1 Tax=Enterobacter mori TaxID=539813 RepID=UPI003B842C09
MAKRKLSLKQFQEFVASLRQTIEAECLGFSVNPLESANRRLACIHSVTGFEYFLCNVFPALYPQ